MDLWRVSWKSFTILYAIRDTHAWFMAKSQNININRGLEEVDSNPQGWLRCSNFSKKRHCSCCRNSKGTRNRLKMWLYLYIVTFYCCNLMIKLEQKIYFLWWVKKVISWYGIYFWWICCRDCWNDNKSFRIVHKLSW